jgi:hypothetical protein
MQGSGGRTLLVKVPLAQNPRLYAGLFARAAIRAGARTRLVVPEAAIERVGQLTFVTVTDDTNQPERRLVTLREYRDGRIEVPNGVAAGERASALRSPAADQFLCSQRANTTSRIIDCRASQRLTWRTLATRPLPGASWCDATIGITDSRLVAFHQMPSRCSQSVAGRCWGGCRSILHTS